MITNQSREDLVAAGAPLRAAYLVEQAGYTLGIAAGDGQALADLLDAGYLDEATAVQDAVKTAMQDKDLMAQESKDTTRSQDRALRRAKLWRRKVAKRGSRMRRMGRQVPDELTLVTRAATVPTVHAQLTTMTASFKKNLDAMGGQRAQSLLDDGVQILADLAQADAAQETTRLSKLPKKVQDFYFAKGQLYVGLKVINDAGQELHADDLVAGAVYNLKILHRHSGKRPGQV